MHAALHLRQLGFFVTFSSALGDAADDLVAFRVKKLCIQCPLDLDLLRSRSSTFGRNVRLLGNSSQLGF